MMGKATETDGWVYHGTPRGGDCRKLVWLEEHGMNWIGIRAYNQSADYWMNNNEPETAEVLCWRDLPKRPLGYWSRGKLIFMQPDDPDAC